MLSLQLDPTATMRLSDTTDFTELWTQLYVYTSLATLSFQVPEQDVKKRTSF